LKISISGIRGVYGQDLGLREVDRYTRLFARIIKSGKCVVGRDTRPSGRIISQVASAALMSNGIDVYNLGVAPTPAVFREAIKYGSGMIITASHNPIEWNGLKFVFQGRGLFEDELDSMVSSSAGYALKAGTEFAARSTYVDEIAELTKSESKVKVGIDLGGGAACGYAEQLFTKLGDQFSSLNAVPGESSRGPDPTTDPLTELSSLVVANKLEHGFALDLDADRLVVVNGEGKKLAPDATLLLCIARALEMGLKTFVVSIDTSVAIEKYVKERKGTIERSKVGEANVVRKMIEENADAGGEGSSAGFIMPRFTMCRDGLLAAATISTLDKKRIHECLAFASQYSQVRSKIAADSSQHKAVIDKLEDILKADASSVITGDGLKAILDEDSWILVRPSNTEHAIRISVESRSGRADELFRKASEKVQSIYEQIN
jgi:phosphomannomutase